MCVGGGKGSSFAGLLPLLTQDNYFFLFQQAQEREEVLKVPCLSAAGGRHSRVALAFMESLWSGGPDGGGFSFWVHCLLSPVS